MSSYYIYLISSLPVLAFGLKPPLSLERFIRLCEELIPEEEARVIRSVFRENIFGLETKQTTLLKWMAFEKALRNELVKIRAVRKKIDPEKYMLRPDTFVEPFITHLALSAHRSLSVLEGERMLDRARWQFLEELMVGHYFDLDYLVVYALKLLILEKWEKITTADKKGLVEGLLRS